MWIIGAVPQMIVALLLALIFTGTKLKIKGSGFFKESLWDYFSSNNYYLVFTII